MLKRNRPDDKTYPCTERFLFATGIECSYPTIRTHQGKKRRDELEVCGHYQRWKEDFQLVRDLGARYLRYGPPYYRMHGGPGRYDWDWTDQVLPEIQRQKIIPIIDLCHFGVPDWLGDFQNPDFPSLFARYARAFAERYAWVRFYTPVNEMFVAAQFSAWYGFWNECRRDDRSFVTAIKNLVRANIEAMCAIMEVRPDALFIQSESSQYNHTMDPKLQDRVDFLNNRRFLTLDLNYGHAIDAQMYRYLRDNGMTEDEFDYFMGRRNVREHCIMGNDYYVTNEYILTAEDHKEPAGETFGYYVITKEYYDRYNLPVMHTETNNLGLGEDEAVRWLWKTWSNIRRLRLDGVPILGMTWYSLTDQIDWDTGLREDNGRVNPVGLYSLDRTIHPVGKAYRQLIHDWSNIPLLPNGPLSLTGDLL